jgi:uncharacterized protein (DUF2147 family)
MKKIMFLGVSFLGISNLANAWEAKYPQSWSQQGGQTTVSCDNVGGQTCMSGPGKTPKVGQTVDIWHYGKVIGTGTVIRTYSMSEEPSDDKEIINVVAETEVALDQISE